MPYLSEDLGDVSDRLLMDLYQKYTEWTNYMAVHVTKAEVDEDDAEAALREAESTFTLRIVEPGKPGIQRAIKQRDLDPEIRELSFEVRKRKALRKMLQTRMQNNERSIQLISRELSRRIGLAGPTSGRGLKP